MIKNVLSHFRLKLPRIVVLDIFGSVWCQIKPFVRHFLTILIKIHVQDGVQYERALNLFIEKIASYN